MEENDSWMLLGTCRKHERPCERYLSAGKMHRCFTGSADLGRLLKWRCSSLSAGCKGKTEGKNQD
jgi:hypothetical protein